MKKEVIEIKNKQTIIDVPLCHLCKKESPTLISHENITGEDSICEHCFFVAGSLKRSLHGICPVCNHAGIYHDENCLLLRLSDYYIRLEEGVKVVVHEDLWIEAGRLRVAAKSEGKVTAGMFPNVTHILRKGSKIKIIMEGA